ncbi:MAG: hypothetical protein JWP61_73 [Friedmanniella sp.]|nr:hypothetical protein [Friedmanniella sp.]
MVSHSWDVLARLSLTVPEAVAARADARPPGSAVSPAVPSASVVLLREGGSGLETYLLHRHARMPFAPSFVVFPGGGEHPDDRSVDLPPRVACALRETAEETGVRLTPDALRPWAHWITPEVEPRRYDTVFFVAALPPGAEAADVSGETDRAGWTAPAQALSAWRRGAVALMPPTVATLTELAEVADLAAVEHLARDRVVARVLPVLVPGPQGWTFRYPGHPVGPR